MQEQLSGFMLGQEGDLATHSAFQAPVGTTSTTVALFAISLLGMKINPP